MPAQSSSKRESIESHIKQLNALYEEEKRLLGVLKEVAHPLVDRLVSFIKKGQEEAKANNDGIAMLFFNNFGLYPENIDSVEEGAWVLDSYGTYAGGKERLLWKNHAARSTIHVPVEYFNDPDAWESWLLGEISKVKAKRG